MRVSGGPTNVTTNTQPAAQAPPEYISLDQALENYGNSVVESYQSITNYTTKNLNGIYGIPYQFMASVDERLEGCTYGATYGRKDNSSYAIITCNSWKSKLYAILER